MGLILVAIAGFALNGEHFKIRGFCDHNNFAVVGMAVPDRVNLFRAQVRDTSNYVLLAVCPAALCISPADACCCLRPS